MRDITNNLDSEGLGTYAVVPLLQVFYREIRCLGLAAQFCAFTLHSAVLVHMITHYLLGFEGEKLRNYAGPSEM